MDGHVGDSAGDERDVYFIYAVRFSGFSIVHWAGSDFEPAGVAVAALGDIHCVCLVARDPALAVYQFELGWLNLLLICKVDFRRVAAFTCADAKWSIREGHAPSYFNSDDPKLEMESLWMAHAGTGP
jgi:hypothetical protein